MQKRSVATVILLSIITCGIYSLYWMVVTTNDIEYTLGKKSDGVCRSGGIVLLLSIVTCGIYTFYWYYKEAQRLKILAEDAGVRSSGTEDWVYLVVAIFGLGIVDMAIMQDEINMIVEAVDSNKENVVLTDVPEEKNEDK